jgi:rhodanese-related sulfurtransferase
MIKASAVYTNLTDASVDQYIIDIRSATDFAAGHITGAVNVAAGDVLDHYEANNLENKDVVVIACYSGQTAGWLSALMHTVGKTNTKDLKWGMSSWNSATSGSWINSISDARQSQLVTTATNKGPKGDLPELNTGFENAEDILRARVEAVIAEGFAAAKMTNAAAFDNPGDYYIVNYWSVDHYNWGHIPGAIQYTVGQDLNYDTDLTTLPTDKTVAVYCYTGQTSAHVAAYLRVLGYDAKSILFGVNAMWNSEIPANKFVAENEVHEYELVQ